MKQLLKGNVWGDYFGDYGFHIDNKCDPGGWGSPVVSVYKDNELVEEISICSVTFEQQKTKLQEFYDNWVKPMNGIMSPDTWTDVEKAIKKHGLVK